MSETAWLGTSYPHPDALTEERWARLMMSRDAYEAMVRERAERDRLAPGPGQLAPEFEARRLDATGSLTGETFRLSSSRGRPIGLIFGSYT